MDVFNKRIIEMEKVIFEELDKIAEITTAENINEGVDTVKIMLSGRLAEIRMLVTDKIRIRHALINPRNRLNMIDQKILVFLNGGVKTRGQRVKGVFTVTYNTDHSLNIALQNTLAIKTRDNCFLLSLLAACNQCCQLKIRAIVLFSPWQKLKTNLENLALWKVQNFTNDNGTKLPDHNLLAMLFDTINTGGLDITVLQPESTPLRNLYDALFDDSKKTLNEQL